MLVINLRITQLSSARIGNWEAGKGHRIAWMTKCSDAPNTKAFTPQ
jgi:hypothetical protein